MRARRFAIIASMACISCSLVNQPDIDFLDVDATAGRDDAGHEGLDGGDDLDGGSDGGDAGGVARESCAGDEDEDLDELVDCQDPDCFGAPTCCPRLGTILDDDFRDQGWDADEWAPFSEETPPMPSESLRIDFGAGSGLFAQERIDLSYGLHVELRVAPRVPSEPGACAALAGCRDHVGVALTPVGSFTAGVDLPLPLYVAVTAGGELLVSRGGVVRARQVSEWAAGGRIGVAIDVLPAGQVGRRGFRVEVNPTEDSDARFEAWAPEGILLDETDNLGADGTRGAYLALMGRSETGAFTTLGAKASFLGCNNPAVFVAAGEAPLTATTLGLGEWALGSIGAPAAADAGEGETRLLFDASDIDLGLERYHLLPRSIGEANYREGRWGASPSPVFGADPPSSASSSVREPAMLADDATKAWMAASSDDQPEVFSILAAARAGSWGAPTLLLSPADLLGTTSLRSPAVARIDDDEAGRYHMWFIGLNVEDDSVLWHAVGNTSFDEGSVHDAVPVLTAADVGSRAARGLSEPLVVWDAARRVFLLWFLAEDSIGRRTLHHAIAPESGDHVELYDGNPVLDPQDPVLGNCDQGCTLRGGTVLEEDGGRRTFLFSRSAGTEISVHEIVTLTQQAGGES